MVAALLVLLVLVVVSSKLDGSPLADLTHDIMRWEWFPYLVHLFADLAAKYDISN